MTSENICGEHRTYSEYGPPDWLWGGFALGLLFLAMHTIYVVTIGADVAYMDSLRYIAYYFDRPWNAEALGRFWNQGDHRGLLSQFVLWINIRVLGMNMLVANILTGFVLIGISLVLFRSYLRFGTARDIAYGSFHVLIVLVAFLAVLFSLAGFELYTLDLGFPENLRNLLFLTLVCWLLQRGQRLGLLGCFLLSMTLLALMLLCAYGRVYAFSGAMVIAVALAVMRGEWYAGRLALICVIGGTLIALVLYVVLGAVLPQGLGRTDIDHISAFAVARGILLGGASTIVGVDVIEHFAIPVAVLGIGGLLLLGLLVWIGCEYLATVRACGSVIPIFLVAYGLINVLAVAVSRGAEPMGAMASRYYPDFCWLLLGLIWMMAVRFARQPAPALGRARTGRWLVCIAFLPILLGYAATQATETVIWPYRKAAFDAMRQATLVCGEVPASSVELLQATDQQTLERAISLQRQYRLGVWRNVPELCGN